MNPVWQSFAYNQRINAALDDLPVPSRRELRRVLKHLAPRELRRAVFGAWRNRGR